MNKTVQVIKYEFLRMVKTKGYILITLLFPLLALLALGGYQLIQGMGAPDKEIEVTTIDKKTLRLKIPPGTQSNAKFRFKGYGMPHMNGNGRGDAYVEITIAVPKKLNKSQKEAIETLRRLDL